MSTAVKVILGVIVSFVLIVVIVVVIAVYWFAHHGKELVEGPKRAMEDGQTYGRTTDNNGCVDKAFEREKTESGFSAALSNSLFLRGCLDTSKSTPNFCSKVPEPTSIIESSKWLTQQCKQRAPNDQYCTQLYQQVQQFCYTGH